MMLLDVGSIPTVSTTNVKKLGENITKITPMKKGIIIIILISIILLASIAVGYLYLNCQTSNIEIPRDDRAYQSYQIQRDTYRFGIGDIEKSCNPFGEEEKGKVQIWIFEKDEEGYEVDVVEEGEVIGETGYKVLNIGKEFGKKFVVIEK